MAVGKYDLTTLTAVKNFLSDEPDKLDVKYDRFLLSLIRATSSLAEKYCRRKFRYQTFTEYFGGDGYRKSLTVANPPIHTVTSLHDDGLRVYGSDSLINADDYIIRYESGIVRLDGLVFGIGEQNIRLIYTGGFGFVVTATGEERNDKIDIKEDAGGELTATLTAGAYSADGLATEVKTQLESAGIGTYAVSWNRQTGRFKITVTAGATTFDLLWSSGTNALTSAAELLGYDVTLDKDSGAESLSDYPVIGLPGDLEQGIVSIIVRLFKDSFASSGHHGKSTVSNPEAGSVTILQENALLPIDKLILNSYVGDWGGRIN